MEEKDTPATDQDRYLIIPLIVKLSPLLGSFPGGKPPERITPDDVIDFFQGIEQFTEDLTSVLHSA